MATEDRGLSHSATAAQQTAALHTTANGPAVPFSSEDLLETILASLADDKAEEVVSIDLKGKSEVADYMVICSGRSTRQVAAISEKMMAKVKETYGIISRAEGKGAGDWVLIDTGDVIVHVFRPEVRDFYQLEKMWQAPVAADA